MAPTDEFPIGLFGGRTMSETRIPGHGHRHTTPIHQVDCERVLGDADLLRECLPNLKG